MHPEAPITMAQTDVPYARDRLVIIPLGDGRLTVEATRGADKWGDPCVATS